MHSLTILSLYNLNCLLVRIVTKEYADEICSTWPSATFVDYDNDYTFILTGFVGSCNVDKETARAASEIILNDILSHPEAI